MKLFSWNISRSNKKFKESLRKIQANNYDVICFQEATADMLLFIKDNFRDSYIYSAKETFLQGQNIKREVYLVTITKKLPREHRNIKHTPYLKPPLRYKTFNIKLDVEALFLEIEIQEKAVIIINCHLECVNTPQKRMNDLKRLLEIGYNKSDEVIICGDFNTFNTPLTGIFLGWLFGYKYSDILTKETKTIEKIITEYKLQNPFRDKKTCLYTNQQLDYILVDTKRDIIKNLRSPSKLGSDHYPLCLEIGKNEKL